MAFYHNINETICFHAREPLSPNFTLINFGMFNDFGYSPWNPAGDARELRGATDSS